MCYNIIKKCFVQGKTHDGEKGIQCQSQTKVINLHAHILPKYHFVCIWQNSWRHSRETLSKKNYFNGGTSTVGQWMDWIMVNNGLNHAVALMRLNKVLMILAFKQVGRNYIIQRSKYFYMIMPLLNDMNTVVRIKRASEVVLSVTVTRFVLSTLFRT